MKNAKTPEQEFSARRSAIALIERESQEKTGLRSDVVTLYQGGEYWLYRYKKYTDVRLVFAPEQQAAFFGGDPDNFTFPRHDLDMALFRVYENGKPIESKDYLKWNPKGAADEELVFVSGHPGTTQRLDTMAQLIFERDIDLPASLRIYRSRIAVLKDYSAKGAEQEREAGSRIFNFENSIKAVDGDYTGLKDPAVMGVKQKEEDAFRAKVMANAQWKAAFGGAWDAIAGAEKKAASRIKEQDFHGLDSELANLATSIVQYVAEVKKPDGERLPGFHDAELDSLKFRLFSPAPIYPQMEIARITGRASTRYRRGWEGRSLRQDRAERQVAGASGDCPRERDQARGSGGSEKTDRRRGSRRAGVHRSDDRSGAESRPDAARIHQVDAGQRGERGAAGG